MSRKRRNSGTVPRPQPSAMFAAIDADARVIWSPRASALVPRKPLARTAQPFATLSVSWTTRSVAGLARRTILDHRRQIDQTRNRFYAFTVSFEASFDVVHLTPLL